MAAEHRQTGTLSGRITGFDAARHLPDRLLPQADVSTRLTTGQLSIWHGMACAGRA